MYPEKIFPIFYDWARLFIFEHYILEFFLFFYECTCLIKYFRTQYIRIFPIFFIVWTHLFKYFYLSIFERSILELFLFFMCGTDNLCCAEHSILGMVFSTRLRTTTLDQDFHHKLIFINSFNQLSVIVFH